MNNVELASKIRGAIGRGAEQDDYILDLLGENLELLDVGGRTPIFHAV